MLLIDMLAFHPMRDGMLDNLNWSATFVLSIQKHARWMFSYNWYSFCRRKNTALACLIIGGW
jgi:hypothetical protein